MRVLIDKSEVDVLNDSIPVTRQGFDYADLSIKKLDYSAEITMPFTNRNHKALNRANDKEYKQAEIYNDELILKGKAFVNNKTSNGYIVQIIDAAKELFLLLDENINTIENSDQFAFNATNINARKGDGLSYLFIFPDVYFDKSLSYSIQRPFLNCKALIDLKMSQIGWAYSFDTDILNHLAISVNHEKFYVSSYRKSFIITSSTLAAGFNFYLNPLTPLFNYGDTVSSTTVNVSNNTIFRLKGTCDLDTDIIIRIEETTGDLNYQEFYIEKENTEIDIRTSELIGSVRVKITYVDDSESVDLNLNYYTLIDELLLGLTITNYEVPINDNLPNISFSDILKTAIILSNSIIYRSNAINEVTFKSFSTIKAVKNWSSKFIKDSENISYISELYQVNRLVYENDEFVKDNTGNHSFEIDDTRLQFQGDFLTMPFSASDEVNGKCWLPIYDSVSADDKHPNQLSIRLIYNNTTIGIFSPLKLDVIYNNFYKHIFDSFSNFELLEADFYIKAQDFNQHDFSDLVYIDSFQKRYIVMSIEDYVKGLPVTCKLLKYG